MTRVTPAPGPGGAAEASLFPVFALTLPAGSAGFIMAGWRRLTFYGLVVLGAVLIARLESPGVLGWGSWEILRATPRGGPDP